MLYFSLSNSYCFVMLSFLVNIQTANESQQEQIHMEEIPNEIENEIATQAEHNADDSGQQETTPSSCHPSSNTDSGGNILTFSQLNEFMVVFSHPLVPFDNSRWGNDLTLFEFSKKKIRFPIIIFFDKLSNIHNLLKKHKDYLKENPLVTHKKLFMAHLNFFEEIRDCQYSLNTAYLGIISYYRPFEPSLVGNIDEFKSDIQNLDATGHCVLLDVLNLFVKTFELHLSINEHLVDTVFISEIKSVLEECNDYCKVLKENRWRIQSQLKSLNQVTESSVNE